jgi:hypothetical protein
MEEEGVAASQKQVAWDLAINISTVLVYSA